MEKNTNYSEFLNETKFFVIGAARSGIHAAKILKKFGASVFVSEAGNLSQQIEKELIDHQICFESGGHSYQKIIQECDVLVFSPGIPLHVEIALLAKKHRIPIVSEIEVAGWFLPHNTHCLGITGTNGKSTTTNYVAQLLYRAGQHAVACGNIGKPFSQMLCEQSDHTKNPVYALELSSYQLETTYSFRPYCTAILNLQNDHMERYENINEYLKAKWRLALLTRDDGVSFIDEHVLFMAIKMGLILPRCKVISISSCDVSLEWQTQSQNQILEKISFGKTLPMPIYHGLKNLGLKTLLSHNVDVVSCCYDQKKNAVEVRFHGENQGLTWQIQTPCLAGEHNALNILYASLMAKYLGVSDDVILAQWEEQTTKYQHLPHRLERIGARGQMFCDAQGHSKKISVINDSKATNVESTLVAVKSFQQPIRLLLGGRPKGDSYLPLVAFLGHAVVKIYPFGNAGPLIFSEIDSEKSLLGEIAVPVAHLIDAANLALSEAQDGDVILLSPGCSSFDEFKDFEHRGNTFRNWAISCFEREKSDAGTRPIHRKAIGK